MDFAMKSYSLVFICICITCDKQCQGKTESSAVIIPTRYGLLKGQTRYFPQPVRSISLVNKFLGVPYAAPPIGELRFRPPQKPNNWEGVYDATRFKPVCYQDENYNTFFWEANATWPQSEDCLYLNVYTPNTTSDSCYPVMVYIHGGGYEAGSPVVSPGDALPMWEVVLVTIQYRLGPFGFISTGDSAAPGNYGMLDQIEALKWIQLNIEAFKGDPSRVTIFGESAGGSSVGLLLLSPLSAGLFHRAIPLSGNDFSPFAFNRRKDALNWSKKTAKELKCPTETSKEMMSCMRNVSAKTIHKLTKGHINKWRPLIDGIFLHDTPKNLRKANKFHPYPLMVGVTSDDGSYFFNDNNGIYRSDSLKGFHKSIINLFKVILKFGWETAIDLADHLEDAVLFQYTPWSKTNSRDALRQGLTDLVTDFAFAAPAHAILELHAKVAPTYLFVFSHRSKLTRQPLWKGATHKDDTPYEFGFPFMNLTVLQQYDEHDKNVSAIIIALFTNFARTGNPTPQPVAGCTWTQFNETTNPYLNITSKPKMQHNFHIRNIAFWNKYYPKLVKTSTCEDLGISGSTSSGLSRFFTDPLIPVLVACVMTSSLVFHY